MTEDEAKTKWCPFVRVARGATVNVNERAIGGGASVSDVVGGVVSSNRPAEIAPCIASACMAWRTAQVGRVLPGDEYKTYREEGYCGLAGAVQ